jgi:glycolate oxidase FAD binding subunit
MDPLLARELTAVVGAAHCLQGADRGPYVVDGRTPGAVVLPGTTAEVQRVVRAAAEAGWPVVPWGGGTRMALGPPPREGALVLVTRRLRRVVEHEPGDLTATVEAGLTIEALQAALGARGQWLPLDPPLPGRATLGGVLAATTAGPRRQLYGTARDLVIGLRIVGPDGELVRAGGKVVKNVAGYDLAKLHIGALGTLGILVEVSLKLRPRPEADRGLLGAFPNAPAALAAARGLVDLGPHSLEAIDAVLVGAGEPLGPRRPGERALLLVAFEGLQATVAWQCAEAGRRLRAGAALAVTALDEAGTTLALDAVRDCRASEAPAWAVATVVVPGAALARYLAAAVQAASPALAVAAHAGLGIATLFLGAGGEPPPSTAQAIAVLEALRAGARAHEGHLRLDRAPLPVKEKMSVWEPPGPTHSLMRAIKTRLDPAGVMNPGRFVEGL